MRKSQILWGICFVFFSLQAFSQQSSYADSVKQLIKKQDRYDIKIEILQTSIKKIYATKFDETIELSRTGLQLAENRKDPVQKGDFLRFIGLALAKKGNIDSATIYYYNALKILEPTANTEKLGLLYDDMARMYRKLKQSKRALQFYDKALALYEAENNLEGIARINNESGSVYRDDYGNYQEAKRRFQKSLQLQQQRKDSVGIGYALEFLGYNEMLVKDYDKSASYLTKALDIRKNIKDDFALMLNYTALGELYKETKRYQLSNSHFEKSNEIARKINFQDIQRHNFQKMVDNYEALENYPQALASLKAYNVINDSIYNTQKLKNVEEITAKYETAEKEKQILLQREKLRLRNQWIFGLTALAFIIGLIGFLLYKQQTLKNHKQKKESELKLALGKIANQNKLQEQRLAISRDLHDNIGAQLSFIVSAIHTVQYYKSEENQPVNNKLNHIATFAKETIQELRDTIWAMNKPGITLNDLQSRIANFIEKGKQAHPNIKISLQIDQQVAKETPFTSLQGLNIFRIIQEATNNALKYAKANAIDIQILQEGKDIVFQVQDDGEGFVENEIEAGNGLQNMRKRAGELPSLLNLISVPQKGTKVEFRMGALEKRVGRISKRTVNVVFPTEIGR